MVLGPTSQKTYLLSWPWKKSVETFSAYLDSGLPSPQKCWKNQIIQAVRKTWKISRFVDPLCLRCFKINTRSKEKRRFCYAEGRTPAVVKMEPIHEFEEGCKNKTALEKVTPPKCDEFFRQENHGPCNLQHVFPSFKYGVILGINFGRATSFPNIDTLLGYSRGVMGCTLHTSRKWISWLTTVKG